MPECIEVMEEMFCSLAKGECIQPLRSVMWVPGKKGLMGMMPGCAERTGIMGIKVITMFPANQATGNPTHQGVVILFDAANGQTLMLFDAAEITAIRTAAASAVATKTLAKENAGKLAIIGSGEQAQKHIEAMMLVRKIEEINIWSRHEKNAATLASTVSALYSIPVSVKPNAQQAVSGADIICTVTSSPKPVVLGSWIHPGTHINAVGSSTPFARELDTEAIAIAKLYTDRYESLFNEAGDFLVPKNENAIGNDHVQGELGEVLIGSRKGRQREDEITIFKSLGIAAEDIFSCIHIYRKIKPGTG